MQDSVVEWRRHHFISCRALFAVEIDSAMMVLEGIHSSLTFTAYYYARCTPTASVLNRPSRMMFFSQKKFVFAFWHLLTLLSALRVSKLCEALESKKPNTK